MDKHKNDILDQMILKLREDPDEYERMFAAQYLAKYSSSKTKKILLEALANDDPETIESIKKILKIDQSRKK
ncbi:MAG: HEAT repeat domain-containing protein [Candidatus Hodarchaeales archaeon]